MLANDMKRGTMGILRNGFKFRILDNKNGMIRRATVYGAAHGFSDEMGTIYIHDIALVTEHNGLRERDAIDLTASQIVKSLRIKAAGF